MDSSSHSPRPPRGTPSPCACTGRRTPKSLQRSRERKQPSRCPRNLGRTPKEGASRWLSRRSWFSYRLRCNWLSRANEHPGSGGRKKKRRLAAIRSIASFAELPRRVSRCARGVEFSRRERRARGEDPMWRTPSTLALLFSFALASPALGADSWSNPHPGMALLRRTTSTPWRIFALEVDLCARGVSVRATAESERRKTPTAFRSLTGAQAVVNGDFFSFENYYPIGLAVGQGGQWHADNATMGFIAFGPDHSILSAPTEVLASRPDWMREAVGGYPILVENGTALTSFSPAPSHCSSRHPRTAVGLSRGRQKLWLVVVDGRSTSSVGMTCRELATLMADLGAWTALNFDGGGSSAMTIAGTGTVNSPSDGSERTVSNHLAIFADGSGAPGSCDLWLDEV
ncbi:MAG TPA: hypothetical protein DFS52_29515, partial [Myxococcales bacterium]|nr:hypothetical protein [Myxococcales bacterium]